jgi:hypothetical protein
MFRMEFFKVDRPRMLSGAMIACDLAANRHRARQRIASRLHFGSVDLPMIIWGDGKDREVPG